MKLRAVCAAGLLVIATALALGADLDEQSYLDHVEQP